MSPERAEQIASTIYAEAKPVLQISGIGGRLWRRSVPTTDARYGPWLRARYTVLDQEVWNERVPCLYLVGGAEDSRIRYAGISRNRMRDRWRESPAVDHETGAKIANQLFHSQCWKRIQMEHALTGHAEYIVKCINGHALRTVIERIGPPVSGFAALGADAEGIAASVERWLCNHSSERLVSWNVAMTAKLRPAKGKVS
ncbi:hypothetical protein [Mitsuaria sp. WAJ17]|uniref:hypothetical protein n=1 Tax=Mitsuaria sp. WAJ17 TaxID=2761452 RepID=UPI002873C6E8|nr:hypothetical protein [Mitsuaria sp. WAJ17]